MTRQEKHNLTAHIVTDIGDHLMDLSRSDADDMIDSIIESLQTRRTREMILPDEPDHYAELNHGSLTAAERNQRGVFAR